MQSHAGGSSTTAAQPLEAADGLRNRVTLTFDLLTSEAKHAERLPYGTVRTEFHVDSSGRFSLTGRTHRHTHTYKVIDDTDYPTHGSAVIVVGNDSFRCTLDTLLDPPL